MTPADKVEILRACCCVAGADQSIDPNESTLLNKLAREIGVGRASLGAMIDRGSNDPEFHKQQFKILRSDPDRAIATLIEVAMADGTISAAEEIVLRNLAANLQIADDQLNRLLESARQ